LLNNPKYAETIIVLVKYKKSYRWFVTDKEIWFLDLKKLISSYLEKGFEFIILMTSLTDLILQ